MRINLWENAPGFDSAIGQEEPAIRLHLLEDGKPHGVVVVCPGGAYSGRCVEEEGEVPAAWLRSLGIHAVVLDYRFAPYRHPMPILDIKRAIRYVRFHAKEWNVIPDKIGVMGFSAGGHLAACASVFFDHGDPAAQDPIDRISSQPNAAVLCYPVVTLQKDFREEETPANLLGDKKNDQDWMNALSVHMHVTPQTPPTFIYHTMEDTCVRVENAWLMAAALRKHNVETEMHIFPHGEHGVSFQREAYPETCQWIDLCGRFLAVRGFVG